MRKRLFRLFHDERGIALPTALIVLGTLTLIAASLVLLAGSNGRAAEVSSADSRAFALAEGGIGSSASPVSPTSSRAYSVLAAVAEQAGEGASVVPGLVIGATDARFASKISDHVYRFVPSLVTLEDTAGFHGTNERLSVANMGRMIEGYAQLILAMDTP